MTQAHGKRLDALIRDPALMLLGGLLLLTIYLLLRIDPLDLRGEVEMTGFDYLFRMLASMSPPSRVGVLTTGLLLIQAAVWPAWLVLRSSALSIPSDVPDRGRLLQAQLREDLRLACAASAVLLGVLLPILGLIVALGRLDWRDVAIIGLQLLAHDAVIVAWAGLLTCPRPAALWQRLCVWCGPPVLTVQLLLSATSTSDQGFMLLGRWIVAAGLLSLLLYQKLVLWERAPLRDANHP